MKKIRVFSVLLLILSAISFIAFKLYSDVIVDNIAPVVTCEQEELHVSASATEEELIRGVTAKDDRTGDVTNTVVLEKLSGFTKEGVRIATYAAVDESMNVGRAQRTIVYDDYTVPQFQMTSDLCFVVGSTAELFSGIQATSCLDGDLTNNIKYTLEESIDTSKTGKYPIEYRVMDSGGKNVYLNTRVEILDAEYAGIVVELEEYLIYLDAGSTFNANEYYKGASVDGTLKIRSNVETNEAGVYYADYIVTSANAKGLSRLIVVVQ